MNLLRIRRPEFWSWSPSVPLHSLRDEINQLFDAEWAGTGKYSGAGSPALDLLENEQSFVARLEIPGAKKEDINVAYEDGVLTITGERRREEQPEGVTVHRTEQFYGKFQRTVRLAKPVAADQIKASYDDGVLTVTLPKTEAAKPIEVKVN